MKRHTLIIGLGMILTSCAPQGYEAVSNYASQTVDGIACKDQALETKLWDGLKTYLIEQNSMPTAGMLKTAFDEQVDVMAGKNPRLSREKVRQLKTSLHQLTETILNEAPQGERINTPEELLILISAMDVGDRSTVFRSYIQDRVRGDLTALKRTVMELDTTCDEDPGAPRNEIVDSEDGEAPTGNDETVAGPEASRDYLYHKTQALSAGASLAAFGGRWAFATSYQSCQSIQLPSMSVSTPDLQGISVIGKHSDGVGSKRSIASLSKVQATHYYIKDNSSYGSGCFNVRQNPLIYDYGGKPYATTAAGAPIDMFKNNGSGTSVLGIDCSGFVFSAHATAGLRLKEGRALKASDSWAWGSGSYVEPEQNGLTCLAKISMNSSTTIKNGDVVAVFGHVLLLDQVGSDPFGLKRAKSSADCSKMTSDGFDFSVAQSSPSKGAIGLNYFQAKAYLPTSAKMKTGLEKYAYYACLARFDGKAYAPNLGTLSVVRHKGTAACMSTRVTMARESCIEGCSSLVR